MQEQTNELLNPLSAPFSLNSLFFNSFSKAILSINTMSYTPTSNPSHSLSFIKNGILEEKEISLIENNTTCNGKKDNRYDNVGHLGGWGLIETLCNTSNKTKQGTTETEQVYVHPLVKRNSSILSSLSLEMCTENLGSETGSDISENSDEFGSMLMETDNFYGPNRSKPDKVTKKFNRKVEFPPPLSSFSGGNGVLVRHRREEGRLVLEAVTLPPCKVYFQAERVNGRLLLSFLEDNDIGNDNDNGSEESDTSINEEETDGFEYEHDAVEEGKCNCKNIENCKEDDDDGNHCAYSSSEDKMKRIGCGMEVGEFRRLSSCKEGRNRKGVTNCWKTCVAIS